MFKLYKINETFLNKLGDEQAWVIGLIASDGCVLKDRYVTITQVDEHGRAMLEYFSKLIKFTGKIRNRIAICGTKNNYSIFFTSKFFVEALSKFNIVNKKSLIYKFPKLSNKLIKPFIRGYFEGDGSIGIYKVGSTQKFLIMSIVGTESFIKTCHEKIPIKGKIRKHSQSETCWEIRWTGKNSVKFGKWLFSNNKLFNSRKFDMFKTYEKQFQERFVEYKPILKAAKKLYKNGMNPNAIAKKLECNFQLVYKWRQYGKLV